MGDFYPGQKVVCVDDTLLGADDGIITEGQIYIIRRVGDAQKRFHPRSRHRSCETVVLLIGIYRGYGADELGFLSCRFRPLIETDISVFQDMLKEIPGGARELETILSYASHPPSHKEDSHGEG